MSLPLHNNSEHSQLPEDWDHYHNQPMETIDHFQNRDSRANFPLRHHSLHHPARELRKCLNR